MRNKSRTPKLNLSAAMEETLRLYHAWLGYLLRDRLSDRLAACGEDVLRVKAADITDALGRYACTVTRDGEDYVITVSKLEDTPPAARPIVEIREDGEDTEAAEGSEVREATADAAESISTEDTPTEDTPTEDTPTEDTPAEAAPAKEDDHDPAD